MSIVAVNGRSNFHFCGDITLKTIVASSVRSLFWIVMLSLVGSVSAFAADNGAARVPKPTFVMISAYGLYPPIDNTRDPASVSLGEALSDIARYDAAGIVYATLGISPEISTTASAPSDFDPNLYNSILLDLARNRGANIWLQLRYYDNWLQLPAGPVNLTAPDIIADPNTRRVFLNAVTAAVDVYVQAYSKTCTIILGEEETIYHSQTGGGLFWAGPNIWASSPKAGADRQYLAASSYLDQIFANRFTALNRFLIALIRQNYPNCRVGVHIGDEALYRKIEGLPVYQYIVTGLPALDFTFYDLYEKISKADADFERKLTDRITLLKQLGQTVYYLAQLHTTGNFGSGAGRTPSANELNFTLKDASQLGADGFGYYTKNAMPTYCTQGSIARGFWQAPNDPSHVVATDGCNPQEDLDPLDPNLRGRTPVYQSSLTRWRFGLSELVEFQQKSE